MLYLLLAPLFFYSFSIRARLLYNAIKADDSGKIKVELLFFTLLILVGAAMVVVIEKMF